MQPAVFLDRDGTLMHDVGYLSRREDVRWYPWTMDAIRLLNRAGFLVCVTTNQGGIGLGYYEEAFVLTLHEELAAAIDAAGAHVDAWFYCPHHPDAIVSTLRVDCDCRKPKAGMIRQAVAQLPIDLARSFVVGDKKADVGLARSAGVPGIFVRTGHGETELRRAGGAIAGAALVAHDLMEATAWILRHSGFPKERV